MITEAIEEILRDKCTTGFVREVEAGGSPETIWKFLEESGFLELLVDVDDGGAGLGMPELFRIIVSFGRYAVPAPVAQSIAARALLGPGHVPAGMITFSSFMQRRGDGSISCHETPFGQMADMVLAADGEHMLLLPTAIATRELSGVHGSLTATLSWPNENCGKHFPSGGEAVSIFGAALYAAMLVGAMGKVFELTLRYCNDRVQFGKSLGKFQAVQHQLSVMAEQIAAASIAAEAAFRTEKKSPAILATSVAKSRCSEAAALVASTSHALHGAIGVTEEYDLHIWTRRLHEWRMAHGSESHWNLFLGRAVLAHNESLSDFVRSFC